MNPSQENPNSKPVFEVPKLNALGSSLLAKYRNGFAKLGNIESRFLRSKLAEVDTSNPIFVCGLARSGTTVILELLSRHPVTASQRYLDYPMIFTPYWWNRYLGFAAKPTQELAERSHKDGLMVSAESPEAMEEPLWMQFFPDCHDPTVSNELNETVDNPEFEKFYKNHIAKLLLVRNRTRYLAKGNYHIARLKYLAELFPAATFVIPVRDPVAHIASSMKQHRLFERGQRESEEARQYLAQVGHFEFGLDRVPINVDMSLTKQVVEYWVSNDEIRGWATYWSMIHNYLVDTLSNDPSLNKRVKVVRYEQFCQKPEHYAVQIQEHCQLEESPEQLKWAMENIKAQTYYKPHFNDAETDLIDSITSKTYERICRFDTSGQSGPPTHPQDLSQFTSAVGKT